MDIIKKYSYQIGAVIYVIWGILHLFAAYSIYSLAQIQDPTIVQGRLNQAAWNMLFIAVFSIIIAIMLNRKNSTWGYWINLILVSIADIGFILFVLLPGYSTDILGPITWILAVIFTTIGYLTMPRTT